MARPVRSLKAKYSAVDRARLSFRRLFARRPWPLEKPVVVQFPVNDICDSKCQMCNIWQQHLDTQISVDEVRRVLADDLFSEVRSVGINGGEPTLRQDLAEIAGAIAETLPSVTRISLITNALQPARAIRRITEIRERLAGTGVSLDVMVSLDGVGAVHDLVRGMPGNFRSAVEVLDHLLSLRDGTAVRVGCTIIHANAMHLHKVLDFCRRRGVYVKFRLGVPHRRLYNLTPPAPKTIGKRSWIDTRPFSLSSAERWEVGQFLLSLCREYEPSAQQRLFYRSLVGQLVHGKARKAGCDWQHRGVTLGSRGDLMYCAVQSNALGDARKTSAGELYVAHQAHLEDIVSSKCDDCAHDYMGMPGGAQQWRLVAENIAARIGMDARRPGTIPGRRLLVAVRKRLRARRFREARRALAIARPHQARTGGGTGPVVICGWYGTETLGDIGIAASIVRCIRQEGYGGPIAIASLDPVLTAISVETTADLAECQVVSLDEARRLLPASQALVFGGGPLMAIGEMAEMEDLFLRARDLGIPRIVGGCGVGPLGGKEYRAAIASLLQSATARIFRDQASRSAASALGVDVSGDRVSEDPAFAWVRALAPVAQSPRSGPTLALALRDWPYDQYAPGLSPSEAEAIARRFEREVAAALKSLIAAVPGLRILPLPFCTHDVGGDDRRLYWRLLFEHPDLRPAVDTSAMHAALPAERYVALLREADALLAMRFHSIVFGAALGLPTVPLDYTRGGKSAALAQDLGLTAIPVDRVDAKDLSGRIHAALQQGRAPRSPGTVPFADAFHDAWREATSSAARPGVAPMEPG